MTNGSRDDSYSSHGSGRSGLTISVDNRGGGSDRHQHGDSDAEYDTGKQSRQKNTPIRKGKKGAASEDAPAGAGLSSRLGSRLGKQSDDADASTGLGSRLGRGAAPGNAGKVKSMGPRRDSGVLDRLGSKVGKAETAGNNGVSLQASPLRMCLPPPHSQQGVAPVV